MKTIICDFFDINSFEKKRILNLFPNIFWGGESCESIEVFKKRYMEFDRILIPCIDDNEKYKQELIKLTGVNREKFIGLSRVKNKDVIVNDVIKFSFGDKNKDKQFWVMITEPQNGLFYSLNYFIRQMEYIKNEYEVVVDMKYRKNMYLDDNKIGKENSWEYYFDNFSNITLEEIYESYSVIICDSKMDTFTYVGFNNFMRVQIYNKYFNTKENIYYKFLELKNKIFDSEKKYLGVICRGTDYANNYHPYKHPIPLDAYEMVEVCKRRMFELSYDYIYLSTEDDNIFKIFSKEFGEKLRYYNQSRFSDSGKRKLVDIIDEQKGEKTRRELGEDYFFTIALLAQCNSLVGTHCAGLRGAITINGGRYEDVKVVNKGFWGKEDKDRIIIESVNENLIDFKKGFEKSYINGVKIVSNNEDGRVIINGKCIESFDTYLSKNVDTLLNPGIYGFSIEDIDEYKTGKIQIFCKLIYEDDTDELLINRGVIRLKKKVKQYSTILRVKRDEELNCSVGFTLTFIEIPKHFIRNITSYTPIELKDENDDTISLTSPSIKLDLPNGRIIKNGKSVWFHSEEVKKYFNIIRYNGGMIREKWNDIYIT